VYPIGSVNGVHGAAVRARAAVTVSIIRLRLPRTSAVFGWHRRVLAGRPGLSLKRRLIRRRGDSLALAPPLLHPQQRGAPARLCSLGG